MLAYVCLRMCLGRVAAVGLGGQVSGMGRRLTAARGGARCSKQASAWTMQAGRRPGALRL